MSGDFAFRPSSNGYVWEILTGPMTIRHTATVEDAVWTEIGERLAPGKPPERFFEMTLHRIGESDWPGAGAVPPK